MTATQSVPRRSSGGVLTGWTSKVENALRATMPVPESLLEVMASYHLGWIEADGRPASAGGKFVRSNMCCWAAVACGSSAEAALPAACAIELLHSFTLVHDDIQDGDRLRRGRPTVWAIWGIEQAINAGDHLHALGLRVLLADADRADETERRARVCSALLVLDALTDVIAGQTLDLQHEGQPQMGREAYLRMVEAKTGALLGATLEAGAVMAGADRSTRTRLRGAGRRLGVAFQLRDDWLGVWGDVALTGKSRDSDLARRKLTYPATAAYEVADQTTQERLRAMYHARDAGTEAEIRVILEDLGVAELTARAAALHAEQAVAEVRGCRLDHTHEEAFADAARDLVERNR